jgi:hypothetical protein
MRLVFVLMFFGLSLNAQIPLWQLEYSPDSLHVIGASSTGEPIWVPKSAIATLDSIFIQNDTIRLRDGAGNVRIYKFFKQNTEPDSWLLKNGDIWYNEIDEVMYIFDYPANQWIPIRDTDDDPTNELHSIFFYNSGKPPTGEIEGDFLVNNAINYYQYWDGSYWVDLFPINITTEPDSIQRVGNTITLRDGDGSVDLSDLVNVADSTTVVNSYGTIITESPSNTWNITVDSSKFVTPYDLTLIPNPPDSTIIIDGWGITSVEMPTNTYNLMADSSQVFTQYDGTLKQDLLTGANKRIPYFTGTSTLSNSDNLVFNNSTKYLGIGTASPDATIHMTQATGNRIRFTDPNSGTNYKNWQIFAGSGADERNLSFQSLSDVGTEYNFMTWRKAINSQVISNLYIPHLATFSGTEVLTINTVGEVWKSGLNTINGNSLFGSGNITTESALTFSSPLSRSVNTISIPAASTSASGYLTSTDWNIFNNKENAITAGTTAQYWRGDKTFQTLNTSVVPEGTNLYFTNARARSAISLTTSGTSGAATYNSGTGVLNVPNYATPTVLTSGSIPFGDGSASLQQDNSRFFWDNTNKRMGIGTNIPQAGLHITAINNMGNGIVMQNGNSLATNNISQHILSNGVGMGFTNTNRYYALKNIMTSSTLADFRISYWNGSSEVDRFIINNVGALTIPQLATGGATEMVTTNSSGGIGRATIPTGATNLTFTGSSSPFTLNSDTGSDVTITAGPNVSIVRSSNDLNIAAQNTNLVYSVKSGTDVTLESSTGVDVILRDGLGTTVNRVASNVIKYDATDATITNEGLLGVGTGGSNSATITTNTSGGNGVFIVGNFRENVTESTSSNGGNIILVAGAPFSLIQANSAAHDLTTSFSKLNLIGASNNNGDGINSIYDNVNNEIDILITGKYKLSFNCNCKSNTSSHLVEFRIYQSSGTPIGVATESKHYFNNTNEYSHNNYYFIDNLTSSTSYALYAKTNTGTPNINDCNIRFMVERLN